MADTRRKQVEMWTELILQYCRHQKLFVVSLEEPFALFQNPAIERTTPAHTDTPGTPAGQRHMTTRVRTVSRRRRCSS